jgi:hypothetical protein
MQKKGWAMKIMTRILPAVVLVATGFAAGYPIGHSSGFATGSEWAFSQASIISREFGLFMPVNFAEGKFRVVLKQPRSKYKQSKQRADKYESDFVCESYGEKALVDNMRMLRGSYLTQ